MFKKKRTFTLLCYHHYHLSSEFFSSYKMEILNTLDLFPSSVPTPVLLSVTMILMALVTSQKWNYSICPLCLAYFI